jgi:hypothetical protein
LASARLFVVLPPLQRQMKAISPHKFPRRINVWIIAEKLGEHLMVRRKQNS